MILTERLLLFPQGREHLQDLRNYYLANAAHLDPWEPARSDNFHSKAAWRDRLAATVEEHQQGRALKLVIRARDGGEVVSEIAPHDDSPVVDRGVHEAALTRGFDDPSVHLEKVRPIDDRDQSEGRGVELEDAARAPCAPGIEEVVVGALARRRHVRCGDR